MFSPDSFAKRIAEQLRKEDAERENLTRQPLPADWLKLVEKMK